MATIEQQFRPRTIRVYLNQDPTVFVEVKTTEDRVRAKLKSIRRDINYQQFARWAPFAGQPQCGNKQDPKALGWTWTFV
jgi:hypothetical protein